MRFLDSAGLARLWEKIKGTLAAKQDKLVGKSGQVVGFDASGNAAARDAPGYEYLVIEGLEEVMDPSVSNSYPCMVADVRIFKAYANPVMEDKRCRLDFWIENYENYRALHTSVFLHIPAGDPEAVIVRDFMTVDGSEVELILDVDAAAGTMRVILLDLGRFFDGHIHLIIGHLPAEQAGGKMEWIQGRP